MQEATGEVLTGTEDNLKLVKDAIAQVEQERQRIDAGQANEGQISKSAIQNLNARSPMIEEMLTQSLSYSHQGRLPGEYKSDAIQVQLALVKTIARVDRQIIKPPGSSGRLFDSIRTHNFIEKLTPANSLPVYDLIQEAVNSSISLDSLRLHFHKLKNQGFFDLYPVISKVWNDVLKDTAVSLGLNRQEADNFFKTEREPDEAQLQRGDIEAEFFAGTDRFDKENRDFFRNLESLESFEKYCKKIESRFRDPTDEKTGKKMRRKYPNFDTLSSHDQDEAIAESISTFLRDRVTSGVYSIHYTMLESDKEMDFQQRAQSGRTWMVSPQYLFKSFAEKIKGLAKPHEEEYEFDHAILHKLKKPKRVTIDNMINPRTGARMERFNKVLPELEPAHDIHHYLGYLGEFADSELKRLSYGYNLNFLGTKFHFDQEKGIMPTIGGFAAGLSNAEIDEIYADSSSDLVQAAVMMFEQRTEELFRESNWMKRTDLVDKYYTNMVKFKKEAEDHFRNYYGSKYEDWEILRSIFNAELMLTGVFFKFFHHASYQDPDLRDGGGVTVHGGKPLYKGAIYDPGQVAWRFHDREGALQGVDFLPYNMAVEQFRWQDYTKWQQATDDSTTQGKSAFLHLAGADNFLTVKQIFDVGNITKAGGLDTLDGWRLFNPTVDWIRPHLTEKLTPDYFQRDDKGKILKDKKGNDLVNEDVLVNIWKREENVGSDILECMTMYKFVTGSHDGLIPSNATAEKKYAPMKNEQRQNLAKLYEFFYQRYFNNSEVGRQFIKKEDGTLYKEDEFVKMIVSSVDSDKLYKGEKKDLLEKYIYHALTVVMFERQPLKFVNLEKRRDTQNGVTLYDELFKDFTQGDQAKIVSIDVAMKDLSFVQTQLRIDTIDEMRGFAKKYKDKKGYGDLYGDLDLLKSEVNGGKGYVIDEDVIDKILNKHFAAELEHKKIQPDQIPIRINAAKKIYRDLTKRLVMKPEVALWEQEILAKGEKANASVEEKAERDLRINVRKNKFISRAERFSQLYKDFAFGFSPTTGELAFSFFNYSAVGDETIERQATFNADTAENISNEWGKFMEMSRKARKEKSLDEIRGKVYEISQKVKLQWGTGAPSETVAKFLMNREYLFFRQNDTPSLLNFDIKDANFQLLNWATNESSSFSEDDTGGPRSGGAQWELTKNEIDREVSKDTGASAYKLYPNYPAEPKRKKSTLGKEAGFLGRLAEKIAGHPIERMGRDWANELSGVAQKHGLKANLKELFKWEILPRIGAVFIIIILLLAALGFKKDFSTEAAGASAH